MHPNIDLLYPEGFLLKYTLPAEYRGGVLPGSSVVVAQREEGSMVLQVVEHPQFNIRFQVFDFTKPAKITAQQNASILVGFLALKNSIQYHFKGLGPLKLKQGQFAFLHCKELEMIARFQKDISCQVLEISWSTEVLQQALPYFPFLQHLLSPTQKDISYFLSTPIRLAGPKALEVAQDLLKTPYDENLSRLYFEHKVREYLFLLLLESGKAPSPALHLTRKEWEKIAKIGAAISQEPDKRFPIADLAVAAQMNEMKLKRAFKERYGQGIFEFQLAIRMKEARRLLQETDLPIKAIASMVGYQLTSSFITKFREYFGYPPSQVIKQKK
jgi:AraC-like DNA-binding protein